MGLRLASGLETLVGASKFLLDSGGDPNERTPAGPLAVVAVHGSNSTELINLLIDHKANLNVVGNEGVSVATALIQMANLKCLEAVMKRVKLNLNCIDDTWPWTPLHSAAKVNWKEACQFLLEKGVNSSIKTQHGRTAADGADKYSYRELGSWLRKQGARRTR